jgi:platelet-activating factor acetylhydrolase
MPPDIHYTDDVELGSFQDDIEDPDSPLPSSAEMDPTLPKPRWLSDRSSRWRIFERIPLIVQPRLTWKYVFFSLLVLYISYCFIRGSPLLASKLPQYTGKYDVGAIEIEVPLETPRKISETLFKSTKKPAFELETVLFTIYYPAVKGTKSSKSNHPWVPRPIGLIAEGYARVAHVNYFFIRPIFHFGLWALAGSIKIPAKVDVPLYQSNDDKIQQHPVMVFSHGMASSRTDYTHYVGELASRGHVVAIIEHRDGSSPGSLIMGANGSVRKLLHFSESELLYVYFPSISKYHANIFSPRLNTTQMKKEQLAFRQAEIEETIKVMTAINSGEGSEIARLNSRKEGGDLEKWEGRLDSSQFTIGGHSYGATGALQALKGSQARNIQGGIILDPGKSSGPLNHDIDVPILVVHSNSWSSKYTLFLGSPHFSTVKNLVSGVLNRTEAAWFMTSLGTSHPSVTDAPLIEPLLLSWTTGATIDVKEGVGEYVKVSTEFFDFLETGKRRGVLAQGVTHEEYGNDTRSEEQKEEQPKDIAKYWQIHVAPPVE